jgi:hypothetical protein
VLVSVTAEASATSDMPGKVRNYLKRWCPLLQHDKR